MSRRLAHLRVAVVALPLVLAGACSSDDDGATSTTEAPVVATVDVKVFQFEPSPLEIASGTTVTWVNGDDTIHQPTSGVPGAIEPTFDVELDGVDATGSFTFDQPGTYPYFCQLHESMLGEIVVS
jgi:plastocyanin